MENFKQISEKMISEKTIAPKFRTLDLIKDKNGTIWKVIDVSKYYYEIKAVLSGFYDEIKIADQDDYELAND